MVWKNIYFKIYLDFSNIWLVIIIINDFKHHHCVTPPIFFIVSLPNSLLNFRLTFIFEIDFNNYFNIKFTCVWDRYFLWNL